MTRKVGVDLDTPQTFYNPHPGFLGAAIPIPPAVKRVAHKLNGQTLSLREALKRLRAVTKGELSVVIVDINFIMLVLKTGRNIIRHSFRVICFK